jgi:hypothetical protein
MYLETRDIDETMNIYTAAWKKGLKSTYYLHMKPRHTAEQSTTSVNKGAEMGKRGFAAVAAAARKEPVVAVAPQAVETPIVMAAMANVAVNAERVEVPRAQEHKGFGPAATHPPLFTSTPEPRQASMEEVAKQPVAESRGAEQRSGTPKLSPEQVEEMVRNFGKKSTTVGPSDPGADNICVACE